MRDPCPHGPESASVKTRQPLYQKGVDKRLLPHPVHPPPVRDDVTLSCQVHACAVQGSREGEIVEVVASIITCQHTFLARQSSVMLWWVTG